MIEMLEGVPGSGKSYHAVSEKLLPWIRSGRRLYVYIDGIYLDRLAEFENRSVKDLKEQITCWQSKDEVFDGLLTVEIGAAVLLDECQTVFRSKEKLSPDVLRWLETHRHRGIDIVLMCQAAGQCTAGVLRLVEVTTKFRRLDRFGLKGRYQASVRGNPDETEVVRMFTGRYKPKVYAYYSSYSSGAIREQSRRSSIWRSPTALLGLVGLVMAVLWFTGGKWLSGSPPAPVAVKPVAFEIVRVPIEPLEATSVVESEELDTSSRPVIRIQGGVQFDEDDDESWRWIADTGETYTEDELLVATNFHVETIWRGGVKQVRGPGVVWGGLPADIQRMSDGMASGVAQEMRTVPSLADGSMASEGVNRSEGERQVQKNKTVDLLATPPAL